MPLGTTPNFGWSTFAEKETGWHTFMNQFITDVDEFRKNHVDRIGSTETSVTDHGSRLTTAENQIAGMGTPPKKFSLGRQGVRAAGTVQINHDADANIYRSVSAFKWVADEAINDTSMNFNLPSAAYATLEDAAKVEIANGKARLKNMSKPAKNRINGNKLNSTDLATLKWISLRLPTADNIVAARIIVYKNGGSTSATPLGIAEVELWNGTTKLTGLTASATSEYAGYEASKAVDGTATAGSVTGSWFASGAVPSEASPQILMVKLSALSLVSKVRLVHTDASGNPDRQPMDFEVQFTTDSSAVVGDPVDSTKWFGVNILNGNAETPVVNITEAARTIDDTSNSGAVVVTGNQVGSGTAYSDDPANPATAAYDKNTNTSWVSKAKSPDYSILNNAYVAYDFGAPITLGGATYYGSADTTKQGGGSGYIDYSEDNVKWMNLMTCNVNGGVNFDKAIRARYWRLRPTAEPTGTNWEVREVEWKGTIVIAPDAGNAFSINYPTDKGYYVTTTDTSQINVLNWDQFQGVTVAGTTPTGTDIRFLVSFDGRVTWKKWDGTNWVAALLTDIHTAGMTKSGIEGMSRTQWEATGGFVPGTTGTFDMAFGLSSTVETQTPEIDGVTMAGSRAGIWRKMTDSEVQVDCTPTTTIVTNLTGSELDMKVSVII